MLRKLWMAALLSLLTFAVPTSGQAAVDDVSVFVFTGGASVSNPIFVPGLGPSAPVGTSWTFSTALGGLVGPRLCGGFIHRTGSTAVEYALVRNGAALIGSNCAFAALGTLSAGLTGLGVFCGNSSGVGVVTAAQVNAFAFGVGATISWLQSAGTVIPFTASGGPVLVGGGAVQALGAAPGTCGIGGGSYSFAVTGVAVFI
jgi:hypothetical protein